ncbi:MAG: protein translocase subunit SecF [Thermosynechococcaceae cyanobacterium]
MKINLTQRRSLWWGISIFFITIGLVAMVLSWQQFRSPIRPGLDFVGGTRLQFERDCTKSSDCTTPILAADVRDVLSKKDLGSSSIQIIGASKQAVSIRTKPLDVDARTQLQAALTAKLGVFDAQKTQIDTVGPTLGKQLLTSGLLALFVSFGGIILYLTIRFQFDYALFAIVALFHDVLITSGFFSVLGLVRGVEIDSLFIVALLTIIGFSVNDTVVIYDRVRETLKLRGGKGGINEAVELAVNQTLGRSINTSLTTTLPLFTIFLFGGETLKYFALALMVGFIAGTYSSIFIASTLLAFWRQSKVPKGSGNFSETAIPNSEES